MISETMGDVVLGIAVIFARIGGLFLIAPGLSSSRAPIQLRLFLALALALALAPIMLEDAAATVRDRTPASLLFVLGTETIVGLMIGLLARTLFMALSTVSMAIANLTGLGVIPGISMEDGETSQAVANLFTSTALVVLFLTDLHHEIVRAAVGSYAVIGPGGGLDPYADLIAVSERFSDAFFVGLRLAAPFIIYSIIVNFAVGLVNKLTPQLPVFFVALPLITAGGLMMIALAIKEVTLAFATAFSQLMNAL